jgi:nucleotide-binding universal stress UspA family protein
MAATEPTIQSMQFSLLICTNGRPETLPALEMGIHLAESLVVPVTLIGVLERKQEQYSLQEYLERAESQIRQLGVPVHILREEGNLRRAIPRQTREADYLTVIGPLGRPAWKRLVQGRSFRRVLAQVETPILYVPETRWPIQRMLLCLGGLPYTLGIEHIAMYLANRLQTSVTLLHVVEPVQEHWKDILHTDTPQGRVLRQAMESMQNAGIQVDFQVRHGSIVHEIKEEIQRQNYELVAMGSPYSAHSLRHLYMPNVTAEVAESVRLPLLTARARYDFKHFA